MYHGGRYDEFEVVAIIKEDRLVYHATSAFICLYLNVKLFSMDFSNCVFVKM